MWRGCFYILQLPGCALSLCYPSLHLTSCYYVVENVRSTFAQSAAVVDSLLPQLTSKDLELTAHSWQDQSLCAVISDGPMVGFHVDGTSYAGVGSPRQTLLSVFRQCEVLEVLIIGVFKPVSHFYHSSGFSASVLASARIWL